jgi:hypothetical protein
MSSICLGIIVPNLLNPIIAVEDSNYDKDSSTIPHCSTTIRKNTSICSKNTTSEILGSISWIADVVTISFRQTGGTQHPWSAQIGTPEPRHARVSWVSAIDDANNVDQGHPLYAQFLQ